MRTLFLFDVVLLLVELGKVTVEDGVFAVFGAESVEVGGDACEVVEGGRGGTLSLPVDDERVILGILDLSELAKEGRFRRPSFCFRSAPASAISESLPILVVTPLSPFTPTG